MNDDLTIILVATCVINWGVLDLVINTATKANKRAIYDWAQLELLARIAKAQRVPEADIKATFDAIK